MLIYNSRTQQKEVFNPIEPGKVSMYVCGMTVYDLCHIGHARVMVVFDTVANWLRQQGYSVQYVRNITDIDDKIINKALQSNEEPSVIVDRFIQAMREDAEKLGVAPPSVEPRVTEYIPEIIDFIKVLLQKGFAYTTDSGDVYFSTEQFKEYGKLSRRTLQTITRIGERNNAEQKKHVADFVLWKLAKPHESSEVRWRSPWGEGRPGWHIECSVMSTAILGEYFDIHGGGADLLFPHHENEVAQSEAYLGHQQVSYWMHNGFIRVNEEKMSKSLDNFFTIREVLKFYRPEAIRFFLLKTHYRDNIDYSDNNLEEATNVLQSLYSTLQLHQKNGGEVDWNHSLAQEFRSAMDDDLDTPRAVNVLFKINEQIRQQGDLSLIPLLRSIFLIFGLPLQPSMEAELAVSADWIEQKIQARQIAKTNKEYAVADEIRTELSEKKVILEDTVDGVRWYRKLR